MQLEPGLNLLEGAAGLIEVLVDRPASGPRGVALVAHPQPLLGGSAQHKLPAFLARTLVEAGYTVARPNFRGIGASAGVHDHGIGETDDLAVVAAALREAHPGAPLALVGFSFGAYVQARLAARLKEQGAPAWRSFHAGMPYGTVASGRDFATPTGLVDAMVVHGEKDTSVPVERVYEWGRADSHPIVVVPGADHFFTGKLPMLRRLLLRHLA